jgi:hypothetical protein
MSDLSNFKVNAIKSMSRDLVSLQRKLDRINEKEAELLNKNKTEKEELETEIKRIHEAAIAYTGGKTIEEVLNPQSVISPSTSVLANNIDETATPEEIDVTAELRSQQSEDEILEPTNTPTEEVVL